MRTPLVWRLRVTISPWKSLPTFLKEPMLAMSLLLAVFEPATTAASMAIDRPGMIDDAPARGPARSGGCRRGDGLCSRGLAVTQRAEGYTTARLGSPCGCGPSSGRYR